LLGVADGVALKVGVGVGELGSQAGLVVAVASVQVAADDGGDPVDGPLSKLVAAEGSRGLQVLQQLPVAGDRPVVRVWRSGWPGSRVGGLPIQELLPVRVVGGRGLCLAAARAHPLEQVSRPGGRRRPWPSPPLLGWVADRP
jgi:hypothetical protein